MADTDPLPLFREARDRFIRVALLLSSLSILGAGASRIPTWEIAAPVEWLAGTLNVGFLPIFGPVLIVFGFAYLYLTWAAMVGAAEAIPRELRAFDGPLGYELATPQPNPDLRISFSAAAFRFWCFVIPVIAYVILLTTYSEFCARPANNNTVEQKRLCTPGQRALTLLLGANGMAFKPHMASIESNLRARASNQEQGEKARIESVADQLPWIYPPFQTLGYLGGLAALIFLAWGPLTRGGPDAPNDRQKPPHGQEGKKRENSEQLAGQGCDVRTSCASENGV